LEWMEDVDDGIRMESFMKAMSIIGAVSGPNFTLAHDVGVYSVTVANILGTS